MNHFLRIISLAFLLLSFSLCIMAQSDESRAASGLPFRIEPGGSSTMVISGKVSLEDADQMARKPVISMIVLLNGVPVTRANAQASGLYTIRDVPRQVITLVVEVDGAEVSRQSLVAPTTGSLNLDIDVPLSMLSRSAKPGVVSAREFYKRPDSNTANFDKATEAIKAGKEADAIKLLDAVLASDPKDYEAWTELGNIYFRKKSIDNAEAAYFKAIELKRDYFLALINLGKLYFSAKRYDDAILVLTNATKANEGSADGFHFLGESYLAVKKGSLAVPAMNKAIELAPTEKADLHLRLAALYDGANLKKRAADEYKLYLAKRPDSPDKAKYEKYIADSK
jgi:Tfp pilus assembly protein PilF